MKSAHLRLQWLSWELARPRLEGHHCAAYNWNLQYAEALYLLAFGGRCDYEKRLLLPIDGDHGVLLDGD